MNTPTLEQMTSMPLGEVINLKPHQLLALLQEADEHLRKARLAKDWLNGALIRRYEEKARVVRRKLGKDTGIVRLSDEGITVVCDLPKKVEWDQRALSSIVLKLMTEGKKVTDYVTQEYQVSERKFNAWPSDIQALFEPARTFSTGKPVYKLLINDGGTE